MKRAYLILIDFVLPVPLTALMFHLWYQRTGSAWFAAYVLSLGVLFGYIFPGIGTNVLHLWRFNGPFRIGNYFIHHGFMYAPYLALVFYVVFNPEMAMPSANIARVLLCGACIQSVVSCHHDICGVSTGMIEINNASARLGKSPVQIVADFGVIGFALVGASFAASCLVAYHVIVAKAVTNVGTFVLLIAAGLMLMGVAALYYVIKEREQVLCTLRNWRR